MIDIEELRRLEAEAQRVADELRKDWLNGRLIHRHHVIYAEEVVSRIVALRNALPELLKAVEWQSMESAPTDGTPVDLWMEYGSRETDFRMDGKGRWVRKEGYPTFTRVLLSNPIAWRPLPLPPHGGVDVGE